MKRNLFLLFLIVAMAACVTTSQKADFKRQVDFTREMDGFSEYKWGTPVEEIGDALIPEGLLSGSLKKMIP